MFLNSIRIAMDSNKDDLAIETMDATHRTDTKLLASVMPINVKISPKPVISFLEFENLLLPFCGLHTYNIVNWITSFENLAKSFALS